jgi:hypothetical protein
LLQSGTAAIGTLPAMGIIMDVAFQLVPLPLSASKRGLADGMAPADLEVPADEWLKLLHH